MALQPGVFNVTDPTYGFAVLTSNLGPTNTANLQSWISLLLDATNGPTKGQGGTLQFPSYGTYLFSGSVTVGQDPHQNTQPYTIVFMGTGEGAQNASILQQQSATDMFIVDTNSGSDNDIGGTVFQDLMINYTGGAQPLGQPPPAAVHVKQKSQSARITRVTMLNWPAAVRYEHSYRASMIDCTIHTITGTSYPTIGVLLGDVGSLGEAIETYIAGCLILDDSHLGTAVQIYGCEHLRMENTRIEGWEQGILITPNSGSASARKLHFANVSCFPHGANSATLGAAVLITTSGSSTATRYVTQATFIGCELSAPEGGGANYTGGGVVIGPATGVNDAIDQIRLVDCHVCLWNGPGLEIVGSTVTTNPSPSNVEVVGGYYSANGGNSGSLPSAGIAIIGASNGPSGVRVTGAACNNSLYNSLNSAFVTATQKYGISIATAQGVLVRGCDLRGNLTQALTASGTLTTFQLTDSAGYNDQATIVKSGPPPSNLIFSPATYGYYGPAAFYVSGGTVTSINVDNNNTGQTAGGFTLSPGESAALFYSGAPNFFMVGK